MKARLAISLHSLSVRRGDKWALRDINWRLQPGERWALLGHNGAGKTQLLKVISGDVWPTPVRAASRAYAAARTYHIGQRCIDELEAKERVAYLGGERQDKYARYGWNLNVRDVVATGLHRTDLLLTPIKPTEAKRVDAMLRACGLQRMKARGFLSLSYGEKRLTLLARALLQAPDWLLLDEIYNGLDGAFRRRIDTVLTAARRRGQSWIITAHRAMDVPRGTTRLIELHDGRISVIKRLQHSDRARLQATAAELAPGERLQSPHPRRAIRRNEIVSKRSGVMMLRLMHVDLYVEHHAVLRDVNWQLRRGEQWAVLGANGAGKSSFLKLLYGDLSPAWGGRIERAGYPRGTPISEWKRHVGYVSPELQSTYIVEVDMLELVASGRHSSIGLVDALTAADRRAAHRWLKFFKLASLARRRPRELSYGQLRRALIARAMAAEPKLLLLDEPLTGLDPRQRALMKRLLERLMSRRVTLIAAVHHREDLPRGMTHGLHLHKRTARAADLHSAT